MRNNKICNECPYKNKVEVPYEGNLTADIMIVAESPNMEDIISKRIFTGRTGKLISKLLSSIGMERKDVFIANSTRCMIDKDRDSTKDISASLKCCRSYLETAINRIQPKLIVTMGAYALRQVMSMQKIMENRGKLVHSEEFKCPVFVTVHPLYVLRGCSVDYPNKPFETMSMKEKLLFTDFSSLKEIINNDFGKKDIDTSEYKKVDNFDKHKDAKIIAFDLETNGLNAFDKNTRILSIAVTSEKGKSDVILNPKKEQLVDIFENPNIKKIVASRPFDETMLKQLLDVEVKGKIHDVLEMAHIVDENYFSYSLENVAGIYTDLKNIKDLSEGKRASLEEVSEETLVNYNGVDSDATFRSFHALSRKLKENKDTLRYYVNFIQPAQEMFAEIHKNGCKIDTKVLKESEDMCLDFIDNLEAEAIVMLPRIIQDKHREKGLKLSRAELIKDYLFNHPDGLKLTPNPQYITGKTKQPQTNEDHLKTFSNEVPFVDVLLRWKKVSKLYTSYLVNMWDNIKDNDYIYPSTILNRTVTGRCLTGDSKITLENLSKITIKELVDTYDINNKLKVITHTGKPHKIIAVYNNGQKAVYKLKTKSGKSIRATENHPFMTKEGWVKLKNLKIKDKIYVVRGEDNCFLEEIESIEFVGYESTYDLTIEDSHSFIANDFIVHNTVIINPAIQTIPQRGEYATLVKRIFVAEEGWKLGARDLSQSEMRIMGWLSRDKNILRAIETNTDVHTMTAAIVNNISIDKVTEDMRQSAKALNFGFVYGMSAVTKDGTGGFKRYAKEEYGLHFTDKQCREFREKFFSKPNGYYALPVYHETQKYLVRKYGYVTSPLGRVRRLPDAQSKDWKLRGQAERQAINCPTQSFSSDLSIIGMMLFHKAVKEDPELVDKVKLMFFIHDSIMFRAKDEVMDKAMSLLKDCMENRSKEYIKEKFNLEVGYRIDSDGKIGTSWDNLKKIKEE